MRFVVLGDPVRHSYSPAIHRSALAAAGMSGSYDALAVDGHGMVQAVSDIRSGVLDGANVTMPHKQLALALSDEAGDLARRAGAANTLAGRDGMVVAHNTDITGIAAAWDHARLPNGGPVLILGAGGAAAAALVALADRELLIAAREHGAVQALLGRTGVEATGVEWGTRVEDAVLVNATPIGMQGEQLPHGLGDPQVGVFDMAYGAQPTPLVAAAVAAGVPYVDGESMLIAQAAVSFELWTGVTPDRGAMRAGLEAERVARKLR